MYNIDYDLLSSRYAVFLHHKYFYAFKRFIDPAGWIHTVLNYIGPSQNIGIRIYHNGSLWKLNKNPNYHSWINEGTGRIVLGRWYVDQDERYSTVKVDELLIFNRALTEAEITSLSQ